MGLYNFQERFAPFILDGKKTHTIRAIRANADKPGNMLHLYTGLRTKRAKLLMRRECVKIEEIAIDFLLEGYFGPNPTYIVRIDGEQLDRTECETLARRDGFSDFREMMKFWREPKNRLPFKGHVIHWREGDMPHNTGEPHKTRN